MPGPRIRYHTVEVGPFDIHLRTLRDRQEYADDDGQAAAAGIGSAEWSLFGVVWDAGQALARLMVDFDLRDRTVLEVGCGIGLASLVLNKRGADVTATDHHPSAGAFLAENTSLNEDPAIPFVRTGWDDATNDLGRFDLVIGSDLLYARGHARSLSAFIQRHARPASEVILVDGGRGQAGRFSRLMHAAGHSSQPVPTSPAGASPGSPPRRVLRFVR